MKLRNTLPFGFLVLASCGNPSGPSNSSVVVPGQGSYFDQVSFTDTNGVRYVGGYDSMRITFVANGLAMYDKSNVSEVRVTQGPADTGRIAYVAYEASGDFSVYRPEPDDDMPVHNGWVTFPFASQTRTTWSQDTIVGSDTIHYYHSWEGSGTGIARISGKVFSAELVTMRVSDTDWTSYGQVRIDTDSYPETYVFAPSLGMIVSQVNGSPSLRYTGDSLQTLDYLLK